MFTTGSKWFLGLGTLALVLAAAYGWATGGDGMGPVSAGYYGGVGDHFGYALLVSLGVLSLLLGVVAIAVRDADPAALAQLAGTDEPPAATPPAHLAFWPIAGAFGASLVLLGLVISNVLFIAGFLVLLAVLVEWMVLAWSDKATGDPATNKVVRDRLLSPYEVPLAGVLIAGGVVAALSRVFLAVSEFGAVVAGSVIGVIVVTLGALLATRPKVSSNLVAGVLVVAAAGVVTAGVVAAAQGERDIEPHHAEDIGHDAPAAEEDHGTGDETGDHETGDHGTGDDETGDETGDHEIADEHSSETGIRPLVPEGTERATTTIPEEEG